MIANMILIVEGNVLQISFLIILFRAKSHVLRAFFIFVSYLLFFKLIGKNLRENIIMQQHFDCYIISSHYCIKVKFLYHKLN